MESVRYGVIGVGYFGAEIARHLSALPGGEVRMVYDPENADRVALEIGSRTSDSVAGLCQDSEVDAVVVASPNWAHHEAVLAAANAGKHVFSEKPIALSYPDCREMVQATSAAGILFMAGHVMHFMAGVREAKRLIAEGVIGDVLVCRTVRNGWEEAQANVSWKKQRALSGGHLYHHIHELDLVQSMLGPARAGTMVGGNLAHRGVEFGDEDDVLLALLEFDDGKVASIEYGSAFRWPEHYVLIQGTLGAIRIDLQDVGVEVRTPAGSQRFLLHRNAEEDADRTAIYRDSSTDGAVQYGHPDRRPPLWLRGIIEEEVAYFDHLVRGGRISDEFRFLTDGTAAAASIATADALSLSLLEGRKVSISEITGN